MGNRKRLWRYILAGIGVVGVIAGLVPLFRWQAIEEPRTSCLTNLRRLSLALLQYLLAAPSAKGLFVIATTWPLQGTEGPLQRFLRAQAQSPDAEPQTHDWLFFAIASDPRAAEAGKRVGASRFALAMAHAGLRVIGVEARDDDRPFGHGQRKKRRA